MALNGYLFVALNELKVKKNIANCLKGRNSNILNE